MDLGMDREKTGLRSQRRQGENCGTQGLTIMVGA